MVRPEGCSRIPCPRRDKGADVTDQEKFEAIDKLEAALRLCLAELKLVVSDRPTLPKAIDAARKALNIPKEY